MPDVMPRKYEFSHGLCIFLHNELVATVKALEQGGFLTLSLPADRGALPDPLPTGDALFEWLEEHGYEDIVGALYVRSLLPALIADFCHFLLEALNCSRKGKLTVTYALLRKPLRDNLFYLELMAANPDEFIQAFHGQSIAGLSIDQHRRNDTIRTTIAAATSRTPVPELYDADTLYMLRYDRHAVDSFAGLWDQALHLITTYEPIRTEARNLNFIFSDSESHTSQWIHLYTRLPILLSYALDLSLVLVAGLLEYPLPPVREMIIHRQIGLALWLDDCAKLRSGRATSRNSHRLRRALAIACRDCGAPLKFKRDLRSLYIGHDYSCSICHARTALADIKPRAI